MYMINLMIIYDVVNTMSIKNYKSPRKSRVGVNWSTTTKMRLQNLIMYQNCNNQNDGYSLKVLQTQFYVHFTDFFFSDN